MLFDSLDFAIYLPVVFAIYWMLNKSELKWQNLFLLVASYAFYGWWDIRFLILIAISTVVDYFVALGLDRQEDPTQRKRLLWISLIVNLGLLAFFKYANFFIDSFIDTFQFMGAPMESRHLNIILPVGISFYTFQTISYTIDVYRRKISPTRNFVIFAGFVSFFPQLVAGPIERARNLLPQFQQRRTFDYDQAVHGLRQLLWGLFKKVVIANNCAVFVDQLFGNVSDQSGINLFLGLVLFTLQIYADFSGYSDIAIGTARLFGFRLQVNFAYPLFSRNMAELWRRWHISLMTWFKDYIYIPLGGSRNKVIQIRNVLIVFFITGLWHGASFAFIVWGMLNGILCYLDRKKVPKAMVDSINIKKLGRILLTNFLLILTMGFFRAGNMEVSLAYYSGMFDTSLLSKPDFYGVERAFFVGLIALVMLMVEWWGRHDEYGIAYWARLRSKTVRWVLYLLLVLSMGLYSRHETIQFVYFQF